MFAPGSRAADGPWVLPGAGRLYEARALGLRHGTARTKGSMWAGIARGRSAYVGR